MDESRTFDAMNLPLILSELFIFVVPVAIVLGIFYVMSRKRRR